MSRRFDIAADSLRAGTTHDAPSIRLADSTALPAPRTDWSEASPYAVYGTADSLRTLPGSSPVVYRDVSASELFGAQSTLVRPQLQELSRSASLTESPVFQSFVLLLAAAYAILLYRNLGDIRQLLGRISRNGPAGNRLSDESGASGFHRFLNTTTAIGVLFMGILILKYADRLIPPLQLEMMPPGAVLAVGLLSMASCAVVMLYQRFSLHVAGAITRSQPLITQLVLMKRTSFSLTVIITSPALLLYALCPRGMGGVLFYVIAAGLIFTVLLYLKESLNLFLSKKISILHWFLYLCTVEIFPVSLLVLLAVH